MAKLNFEDFIVTVNRELTEFITELHNELILLGCKIEVKEAKSGFVVSYLHNKKTLMNYVFRKKGIIARIYGSHVADYMEFLDTLPTELIKGIEDASICKRLINPNDCNSKCSMGYDFVMQGKRHQKCRSNAFMFLLNEQNNPYVNEFLKKELELCSL